MTEFVRTINISSKDLGGPAPVTLIMTFDQQAMKGIYQDFFPTVWKLGTFNQKGAYALKATYKNQLTFINPQVDNDKIISAATWVDLNHGQKTELVTVSGGTRSFSDPTKGEVNFIKATNQTGTPQNIGVGFDDGKINPPPTMLLFQDVGQSSSVVAQFTPTLSIYLTQQYQETEILRGAVQTPPIWRKNLAELDETTSWTLKRDPVTGIYSIVH